MRGYCYRSKSRCRNVVAEVYYWLGSGISAVCVGFATRDIYLSALSGVNTCVNVLKDFPLKCYTEVNLTSLCETYRNSISASYGGVGAMQVENVLREKVTCTCVAACCGIIGPALMAIGNWLSGEKPEVEVTGSSYTGSATMSSLLRGVFNVGGYYVIVFCN